MSNPIIFLFIIFMTIIGGGSTIYVIVSLPVTIAYKIYRKIKYKESIM